MRARLWTALLIAACGGESKTSEIDAATGTTADAAQGGVADAQVAPADAPASDAPPPSPDAPSPDAGIPDASVPDASLPDASLPDAAPPDAPGTSTGPSLVDPDIQIETWKVGGTVRSAGAVELRLGSMVSPGHKVLNAVGDLNNDGVVAAYAAGAGMQEEWIVRNVPVPTFGRRFALNFKVMDVGVAARATVPIRVTVGDASLATAPPLEFVNGDGSRRMDAVVRVRELASFTYPGPDAIGASRPQQTEPNTEWISEGSGHTENQASYYENGLGEAGPGVNNCVPGTVAANLTHLAGRDGWGDALRESPSDPPIPTGSNEGIAQLQDHLIRLSDNWDWNAETGVLVTNLLAGKNEIAQKMDLPLVSTFIEAGPDTNLMLAISEQVRDGCAVELVVAFPTAPRPPGKGDPGHMVGVAGYFALQGLTPRVIIRDGLTTRLNDYAELGEDNTITDYSLGGELVPAYAVGILVECTAKVPALRLDYAHGDVPAGALVHLECLTGGHVGEHAGGCSCAHYHEPTSITGHGGPYPDNFPTMCGHGCVVEALPKELAVKCFGTGQ